MIHVKPSILHVHLYICAHVYICHTVVWRHGCVPTKKRRPAARRQGCGTRQLIRNCFPPPRWQPYPSCVLHELGDEGLMRAVRREIVENIRATFKETDLFKVGQPPVRPVGGVRAPCGGPLGDREGGCLITQQGRTGAQPAAPRAGAANRRPEEHGRAGRGAGESRPQRCEVLMSRPQEPLALNSFIVSSQFH